MSSREIWLVEMKNSVLHSFRAFETEQEALDYANEEAPGFNRMVKVADWNHIGGSLWELRKIRLGRYEDGS